jgi:hypothetical protein
MAGRIAYYGGIVKSGLVLDLDAAKMDSYPKTGTAWNDISGNKNNGTLTNGPTFNSNNGGSIVFDGSNDYVDIPSNSTIALTGDMTVCAWIYINSLSGYNAIVGKTNGGNPNPYDMYTNPSSGTVSFFRGNGSSYGYLVSNTGVTINTWQHVAITMTSTTATHYLNGQTNGSGTISTTITDGGGALYVGSRADFVTKMNGRISNLLMYNKGLTANEITQNYNASKGRFGL